MATPMPDEASLPFEAQVLGSLHEIRAALARIELALSEAPPVQQPSGGDSEAFDCPYVILSRRTDGKYQADYGLELGDGNIGEYPGLKYVGTEEEVRSFFPTPIEGDLPLKVDVSWRVTFKYGREIKGSVERFGERKFYKDLTKVEER